MTISDFLIDVNVLIAHAMMDHVHHRAVFKWLQKNAQKGATYSVSPIIELGLIRNAMRIGGLSIRDARKLLENETVNLSLQKIPDSISANQLPNWVQGYRQTTDAYLSELAKSHKLRLLTIDKGIPAAQTILPQ